MTSSPLVKLPYHQHSRVLDGEKSTLQILTEKEMPTMVAISAASVSETPTEW